MKEENDGQKSNKKEKINDDENIKERRLRDSGGTRGDGESLRILRP